MEYVTRGPCGQDGCRETRYSLDNGFWFCRRGHQQEGRQIEEDPEDFGQLGKVSRVKKVAAEKIKKTYHGRQAHRLFIQAYQLILWKQCHALVHDKSFPPDLEKVVRDLWELRLRSLVDKFDDSQEEDDATQLFSSQAPTAAATTDAEDETDQETSLTARKPTDNPRLVETLGLCYLAALLLRLPVSIGDIHRFALNEEIPFIRAVKSVPREMRDRLPQEYLAALDTPTLLTGDRLHKVVNQLIIMYSRGFHLKFPPLNAPLMLFEYVRQLALPLEIYMMVKKLQTLVGFTYHFSLSPRNLRRLVLPEAQILSLIVVATKLIFPFDDQKRYPTSAAEPAAQALDWSLWARAQKDYEEIFSSDGRLGKGKPILVSESDVFSMTDQQVDDYLDWYESSWLDKTRPSNPLADMFATGPVEDSTGTTHETAPDEEEEIDRRLRSVMKEIHPSKIIRRRTSTVSELGNDKSGQDEDIPRPGSSYRFYRSESELPDAARAFYDAAAQLSGISVHTLVRAVFQAELRLQDWQEGKRRAEYHGEHVDSETEESGADKMDVKDE